MASYAELHVSEHNEPGAGEGIGAPMPFHVQPGLIEHSAISGGHIGALQMFMNESQEQPGVLMQPAMSPGQVLMHIPAEGIGSGEGIGIGDGMGDGEGMGYGDGMGDEKQAAYAEHDPQKDGALEHMEGTLTQLASGAVSQYEKAPHAA